MALTVVSVLAVALRRRSRGNIGVKGCKGPLFPARRKGAFSAYVFQFFERNDFVKHKFVVPKMTKDNFTWNDFCEDWTPVLFNEQGCCSVIVANVFLPDAQKQNLNSKFVVCVRPDVDEVCLLFGLKNREHKDIASGGGFGEEAVLGGGHFSSIMKDDLSFSFHFTSYSNRFGFVPSSFLKDVFGDALRQAVSTDASADFLPFVFDTVARPFSADSVEAFEAKVKSLRPVRKSNHMHQKGSLFSKLTCLYPWAL